MEDTSPVRLNTYAATSSTVAMPTSSLSYQLVHLVSYAFYIAYHVVQALTEQRKETKGGLIFHMVVKPEYSKNQVRRAGEILCKSDNPNAQERKIVDYWRAAHRYPLDAMESLLQGFVAEDDGSFAACRLKRIDSIQGKLAREGDSYKLNSMYDIAGCRFVANDISRMYDIAERLERLEGFYACKNYISNPKPTGYRSIHVIHKIDSPEYGYENLKVETQVRTFLQHMWATSVEVYDVVNRNALKFGAGEKDERRYFALISNLFALEEHTNTILGTPQTAEETSKELKKLDGQLRIASRLKAYSNSVSVANQVAQQMHADYVLLMIDFEIQQIQLETFSLNDKDSAIEAYGEFERKKQPSEDAVLIKASSVENLKKAYPNYYSDISLFLTKLDSYLGG